MHWDALFVLHCKDFILFTVAYELYRTKDLKLNIVNILVSFDKIMENEGFTT